MSHPEGRSADRRAGKMVKLKCGKTFCGGSSGFYFLPELRGDFFVGIQYENPIRGGLVDGKLFVHVNRHAVLS